jgi:hypothetical protein
MRNIRGEVTKQGSLFIIWNINKLPWVRYRHIYSLFFEAVAISVEALIAVDQKVKALAVK